MNLLDYMGEQKKEREAPLASRLRPATLDEIVGQEHIIGKDKMLYRAIKADKLSSLLFYGPPGTGKTTLARVIANTTSAAFLQLNATSAGKKDMEEVVAKAKENLGAYGRKTILFIDEIHRFNKGQQDYLLPFVEDGTVVLIGATTENPFFEVNGALISRSVIFELKPLEAEDIRKLILRALEDSERGLGSYRAEIEKEALAFLTDVSGGDARTALNAIELGVLTTERSETERSILRRRWQKSAFRSGHCGMTRPEITTTIPSRHSSRVCGDLIRMRRCTIWQGCSMQGRILHLLPDGS